VLYELKDVQKKGEAFRRVFEDDLFDLFIWYDHRHKNIIMFQLSYDKTMDERALTWVKSKGFTHLKVDDPSFVGFKYSPILVKDGVFGKSRIYQEFFNRSSGLEKDLRDFVLNKITEYGVGDAV
jgi:hypothetical protein